MSWFGLSWSLSHSRELHIESDHLQKCVHVPKELFVIMLVTVVPEELFVIMLVTVVPEELFVIMLVTVACHCLTLQYGHSGHGIIIP